MTEQTPENGTQHRERIERVLTGLEELRKGNFILLLDDKNRENEGDLVTAAEMITPEKVNYLLKKARGLICVPLTEDRCDELSLQQLEDEYPSDAKHTAYCMTVDYRHGTSTGISAHDQAKTIEQLTDPASDPEDFLRPGHTHPLKAVQGGVLRRAGHTEGTVDLMRLAGLKPAGVLCEVMNSDGTMARGPELEKFAEEEDLHLMYVADLIYYRLLHENWMREVERAELPTRWDDFTIAGFQTKDEREQHVAIFKGDLESDEPVLARIHSQCLTGEVFESLRCDCGRQLDYALREISERERGVLVYLRQEGRGIGLHNKIRAYRLQDRGMDTVEANRKLGFPADLRDFGIGAQILRELGVSNIRLMTNNPKKLEGLNAYGIEVEERVPIPLEVVRTTHNTRYLETKRDRLGHIIGEESEREVSGSAS